MTRLILDGVGKTYADGTEALRGIGLAVESGEIIAILGGSGCGKTTLLRLLSGLDQPTSGEIRLDGAPLRGTNPSVSAMFQEPRLLPWLTVADNIGFGAQRLPASERAARTAALLTRIGLSGYGPRWPRDLSGGQQQRVSIARALIGHPEILLLDEPFSALDPFTRGSQHRLLLELWRDQKPAILMVTHDVDEAVFLADRIVIMQPRPGRVREMLSVDAPRPRDKLSGPFEAMKRRAMRALDRSMAEDQPKDAAAVGPVSPWV